MYFNTQVATTIYQFYLDLFRTFPATHEISRLEARTILIWI
jgi:hypothetical protein